MTTIKDIASEAGVSIATVSRVMNDSKAVSPELKTRVRAVIERSNFRPNRMARGLITKKSLTIGVIVADISNPVIGDVVKGVNGVCERVGYSPMIFESGGERSKEIHLLNVLSEVMVDGAIFAGVDVNTELAERLVSQDYPIVLVTQEFNGPEGLIATVAHDNELAAREAVDFLAANGHRRISFIGGPKNDYSNVMRRYAGYESAMAEHGFEVDPHHVVFGSFSFESGYECMKRVYEESTSLPSAVIGCSDVVALGAIRFIKQAGLSVPRDISVMGFDDLDIASYASPELSTVRIPHREEGAEAARTLFQLMDGVSLATGTRYIPHKVIRRQSVAHLA